MKLLAAAQKTPLGPITGEGPFGNMASSGNGAIAVTKAVSALIGFLTVIATIWFLVQLLIGGITWISAAGDKNKLTEARERITNAFLGLLVVVAGWAILAIAGQFFGWTNIVNPAAIFESLKFGT